MRTSLRPARTASSTTYWIAGLSTTGSISLGVAFVAGRKRVPSPAAGMTALVTGALMSATLMLSPVPGVCSMRCESGRQTPAVSAAVLGGVQGLVRGPHECSRAVAVVGIDGDADRDGDGKITGGAVQWPRPDPLADPLGEMLRAVLSCFGEYDDELLAAIAGDDVDLAHLFPDPVGHLDEHGVTDLVAVRVVDLLEPVQVEHQQRQRPAEPGGAVDFARERLLEEPVVAQPGEAVGHGQPLRLLMQEHVVDGDGRLAGEALNGLEVGVVERLTVDPVVEVEHAEDPGAGAQRHADQLLGPRLVRRQRDRQLVDATAQGLTRRRHRARDAFAEGDSHRAAHATGLEVAADPQHQVVARLLRDEDGARRRTRRADRGVEDDAEDPVEVVRARQRVAQAGQ